MTLRDEHEMSKTKINLQKEHDFEGSYIRDLEGWVKDRDTTIAKLEARGQELEALVEWRPARSSCPSPGKSER